MSLKLLNDSSSTMFKVQGAVNGANKTYWVGPLDGHCSKRINAATIHHVSWTGTTFMVSGLGAML